MPRIDWTSLPRAVRKHLEDRARTRELTAQDLMRLMEWVLSNPEVPDEPWCKDFGAFKLVGHSIGQPVDGDSNRVRSCPQSECCPCSLSTWRITNLYSVVGWER